MVDMGDLVNVDRCIRERTQICHEYDLAMSVKHHNPLRVRRTSIPWARSTLLVLGSRVKGIERMKEHTASLLDSGTSQNQSPYCQ